MTNHYTDVCEETIESLRQQLAHREAQIVMLREKFQELADNFIWNGDDHSYQHWVIEVAQAALAATEPKP